MSVNDFRAECARLAGRIASAPDEHQRARHRAELLQRAEEQARGA